MGSQGISLAWTRREASGPRPSWFLALGVNAETMFLPFGCSCCIGPLITEPICAIVSRRCWHGPGYRSSTDQHDRHLPIDVIFPERDGAQMAWFPLVQMV